MPSDTSKASDASASSSIVYGHTPFAEFESQVRQLCQEIWPLSIERMAGGSYNRIIGLSFKNAGLNTTGLQAQGDYILRIPRFDDAHLENQIGTLTYLHAHSEIPVPKVVAYDLSDQNHLGNPYLLQTRLNGLNLQKVYMTLNHTQKCEIAREFARILREIRALTFPSAGILCSDGANIPTKVGEKVELQHLRLSDRDNDPYNGTTIYQRDQTPLDMITFQLRRWERTYLESSPPDKILPGYFNRLAQLAKEMEKFDCLPDERMTMCHLDLCPRNVLIQLSDDDSTPRISGVLDWDDAIIAPAFMSCTPPSWLWQWSDEDDEDEATAGDTPADPQMHEIKQVFDDAVGSQFTRLCYPPQYRIARKLTRFAILGLHTLEDLREVDSLIEQWGHFRASLERQD